MDIKTNNIPASLRKRARFCCWRYEDRPSGRTKVPINPLTGYGAKSTDPNTFGTFEQAMFAKDLNGYDGIGIGIFGDICAIDIDHCIDTETGTFSDLAAQVYKLMDSYTEFSPSGEGLRILFRAPGLVYDKSKYYVNNQKIGLEVYVSGATNRYVTITGNSIGNSDINERTEALQKVLSLFMTRSVPSEGTFYTPPAYKLLFPDEVVIKRALRAKNGDLFKRLMSGDASMYQKRDGNPDYSVADLSLCNILAFWCSGDAEQIDRIYRSSGLMRPKWDTKRGNETYGQLTVQKAVSRVRVTYSSLQNERKRPMPIKPAQGQPIMDRRASNCPAAIGAAETISKRGGDGGW